MNTFKRTDLADLKIGNVIRGSLMSLDMSPNIEIIMSLNPINNLEKYDHVHQVEDLNSSDHVPSQETHPIEFSIYILKVIGSNKSYFFEIIKLYRLAAFVAVTVHRGEPFCN